MHRMMACLLLLIVSVNGFGRDGFTAYSPMVVASVKRTKLTTSIPPTTLLDKHVSGLYRISAYGLPTVSDDSILTVVFNYTDDIGNDQLFFASQQGAIGCSEAGSQAFTCSFVGIVRKNAGTPLTYSTNVGGAGLTYDLFVTVEKLQ
jgi:hypothetical protein